MLVQNPTKLRVPFWNSLFLRNLHHLRRKQRHVATFAHQHTIALLKRWFAQNCTFAPRLAFEVAQHALKKHGKSLQNKQFAPLACELWKVSCDFQTTHTIRGIGKWREKRHDCTCCQKQAQALPSVLRNCHKTNMPNHKAKTKTVLLWYAKEVAFGRVGKSMPTIWFAKSKRKFSIVARRCCKIRKTNVTATVECVGLELGCEPFYNVSYQPV